MIITQRQFLESFESGPGHAPSDDQNNSVSRANVFGLFLTLSICLLTQPFGSLLYNKPSSALGRKVFFFWRLNPLACIMEVFLLLIALLDSIRATRVARYNPRMKTVSFGKHLRITAMMVMLIRNHHESEVWRHLETMLVPLQTTDTRNHGSGSTSPHVSLENGAGSDHDEAPPSSGIGFASRWPAPANTSFQDLENGWEVNVDGVRSLQCEIIRIVTDPRFSGSTAERNILTRVDDFIDLISTLAVVLVIVKLASITIPWYICIPAWFMVAGWAAIQAMAFVSRRCHVENFDPRYLMDRATTLERTLNSPAIWLILSLLVLPLVACLAFFALFRSQPIQLSLVISCQLFNILVLEYPFSLPQANNLMLDLYAVVFGLAVGVAVGAPIWCISFCRFIVEPNPSWRDGILLFILDVIVLSLLLMWLLIPGNWNKTGSKWTKEVSLIWNVSMTILIFIGAMMVYDDSETRKPSWVEWLGKLK